MLVDTLNNFRSAMAEKKIVYDGQIIADGKLHRFHINGDKSGSKNGWFILYADRIPSGAFGNWKTDTSSTWCSKSKNTMTKDEWNNHLIFIEAIKKKHAEERLRLHEIARKKAQSIWNNALELKSDHPYLLRKRISSHSLRYSKNKLIIPILSIDNQIQSLQFISDHGEKRFLKDGKLKENFFLIGDITTKIYICEGYATGATIHSVTKNAVFCVFSAGNILNVAQVIRSKYPETEIIIAADNDQWKKINTGIEKATVCAKKIKAKLVYPDFTNFDTSSCPTDFNDLAIIAGIEEVKKQLEYSSTNEENEEIKLFKLLAELSEIDFQRQRKTIAKSFSLSVLFLDKLYKQCQKDKADKSKEMFPRIEAWDEPVNIAELLDKLSSLIESVLVFSSIHESKAIALWIIHTYCLDASYVTPILNINSPEKRCGKSTLLNLLQRLVYQPLSASNISSAALYRSIELWHPTFMLDEADTFMRDNNELRGVINSGHTRDSAFILRCEGDNNIPTRFSTWCAKAIAGIGQLADTNSDRSIAIQLRRKLQHEEKTSFRDLSCPMIEEIKKKCVRFSKDNLNLLQNTKPNIPKILNDRAADNWQPLLSIAHLAGTSWIQVATNAAIYLSGEKHEQISAGVELLQDIKNIFEEKNIIKISSANLLEELCLDTEMPWSTYNRGKPMTPRQLANKLREFKIFSGTVRLSPTETKKGYVAENFIDAFNRYIPSTSNKDSGVTTSQTNSQAGFDKETQTSQNTVLRKDSSINRDCDAVTDKNTTDNKNKIICSSCGYRPLFCSCHISV